MTKIKLQDILPQVQKPSRYLGNEINRVQKDLAAVELRVALAFPDLYEIGTSHFGLQILYHILNQHPQIAAERVYAPAGDVQELLQKYHLPLSSLESELPLGDFDIIGFSLLYELNFTNVLNMLKLADLPVRADQRQMDHPLVIGGGPCTCNPEPVADFFDAMVFGDGEVVVVQMAQIWLDWKRSGKKNKLDLLQQWSRLDGVYIPGFFKPSYDQYGFQYLTPVYDDYTQVRRAIVADLDQASFPDAPVVAFGKPVHDRLRLEISRGCTQGCRFCQAGMLYRPVRERSPQQLLDLAQSALDKTGYDELSLLSLSTGDYTCLSALMETLMQRSHHERVAVSLPSVRAGSLTPSLMHLIRNVRKTGFTIAPEAGSQRLRNVINKTIRQEDVINTVQHAFELGWSVIKLYFMIGLPTETQTDLQAIVDLILDLKQIKSPARRRGQINVSVTTFIPKPHTPFQWAVQLSVDQSREKIEWLKAQLKLPRVKVKWQLPQMSLLEGVFARGDRRLGRVLERALALGCTFDGWNDHFDFKRWQQAFADCGREMDFFTIRQRNLDEPLPWDHMDVRVTPIFLKKQWFKAHSGTTIADCRYGACAGCGVCDFKTIQPRVFKQAPVLAQAAATAPEPMFVKREIIYQKLDKARHFSHLELINIFSRALRRAQIPVQYSQGFHPIPRMAFDDPLPVGMESQAERVHLTIAGHMACQEIVQRLNTQLPQGVAVRACCKATKRFNDTKSLIDGYRVVLLTDGFNEKQLERFLQSSQWPYERRRSSKGRVQCIDLKTCVQQIHIEDARTLQLVIRRNTAFRVRPAGVLESVFSLTPETIQLARILKLDQQLLTSAARGTIFS